MLEYATSELYRLLVAQGAAKPPAGTDGIGDEMVGRSQIGAAPQFARAGEELRTSGGLKLVWTNTSMTKRTRRSSARLVIVE